MAAVSTGAIEEMRRRRARENAGALMGALRGALPAEEPVNMELTLQLLGERGDVRVSLPGRAGAAVRGQVDGAVSAGDAEKTRLAFGKGFVLEPEWMGFDGVDERILSLLQDAAYVSDLEGHLVLTGLEAKYLTLPERFVPRLMHLLRDKPFRVSLGEETHSVTGVFDGQVELLFAVYASGRELEVRAQMPRTMRPLDERCAYVYCEGDVLHLPPSQREIVRVLHAGGQRCAGGIPV